MAFPTGWDGINIDRKDHMSRVAYDMDGGIFDGGVLHRIQSSYQKSNSSSVSFLTEEESMPLRIARHFITLVTFQNGKKLNCKQSLILLRTNLMPAGCMA